VLIAPRVRGESLYIIIKGIVNETVEGELQNVYGEQDSFDANSFIYGNTQSTFTVAEDLICYELPKESFLNLLQDVEPFQSYFMQGKKLGIVTDTNLREKVLLSTKSRNDPIGDIATYGLIGIEKSDFLFNALLLFTKHGIKRLVVTENEVVVGILEQLDLLSHFANHTHLIAASIDRAVSIDELHNAQRSLTHLVRSLTTKGVRVRYVSKLVNELNAKMYHKVFEIVVPVALQDKCALIVMGSEGRGEQILRTDQDNALIVNNDEELALF
jgi:CBS domain-containing protein